MSNVQPSNLVSTDKKHVWHHLSQHAVFDKSDPRIIVKGEGIIVTDTNGNKFLDAVSGGVWTVNVGYGRASIAKAVSDQLIKIPFFAASFGTEPASIYSEQLIELLPHMNRVYYSSSGSEANEKAYKMVRQRAHGINGGKKHKIIFRDRDYHGTTIAALTSSGQDQRKAEYGPYVDGFVKMPHCCCYRCPFGKEYGNCNIECATALEDVILKEGPDSVGSVVLEPITAGGGVIPPVKEYFPIISEICKKYDVLIHIDEVVCGMGRTGKWFGHQHFDVKPDMVTMAKGVASGYAAISITATTEAVFDVFKTDPSDTTGYFRDISTFGGCTSGPAAAIENLKIIKEENLLENCAKMGEYMIDQFKALQDKHQCIGDVRGKGLFAGVELVQDRKTKAPLDEALVGKIVQYCLAQGVLIGATNRSITGFNNTLLFSPSFIITKEQIDQIVSKVDAALESVVKTS